MYQGVKSLAQEEWRETCWTWEWEGYSAYALNQHQRFEKDTQAQTNIVSRITRTTMLPGEHDEDLAAEVLWQLQHPLAVGEECHQEVGEKCQRSPRANSNCMIISWIVLLLILMFLGKSFDDNTHSTSDWLLFCAWPTLVLPLHLQL